MLAETLTLMLMSMGSVGLWTLRVMMAAHDRRFIASGVAALEAVVFALSFSQLLGNLDQVHRLAGYSAGVALGTFAGMCLSQHLPSGRRHVAADRSRLSSAVRVDARHPEPATSPKPRSSAFRRCASHSVGA